MKRIVPVDGLIDASRFGFSHCVVSGNQVFIAGQCGHGEGGAIPDDFAEQCRLTLEAVRLAVEAAGGTLDDIVAMTVFITNTSLGRVFTSLRREYFGERFPTSALIGVSSLMVTGAMIEIQAMAVLGEA